MGKVASITGKGDSPFFFNNTANNENKNQEANMRDLNNVTIYGRLARNPEMRYVGENRALATLTVACNRGTSNGKDLGVDFIRCKAWGKIAENISKYCSKGKSILIAGRMFNESYTSGEETRWMTGVNVREFILTTPRAKVDNNAEASQANADDAEAAGMDLDVDVQVGEEEVPF